MSIIRQKVLFVLKPMNTWVYFYHI